MKRFKYVYLLAALIVVPVVNAQTTTSSGSSETSTAVASFDQLSPGSQMIARSLMDAQVAPADGSAIWTLDKIAAAKSGTGWGNVFATMKADGLINARNLGQVVSAYARSTNSPITGSVAAEAGIESSNAASGDTGTQTQSTGANGTTQKGDQAATFTSLSPGNQKIARALMDAQTLPSDGTTLPLTLDQIAAAKSGTGWGQVFQQMQSEGLITAKNLGQVVSNYETSGSVAAAGTATTAFNTSTGAVEQTQHGDAGSSHSGDAGLQGSISSEAGLTTASDHAAAMGNAGITTAEGEMAGPGADASISASDAITSASGTTFGMSQAAAAPGVGLGTSGSLGVGVDAGGGSGMGASMGAIHSSGHGH